MPLNRPDTYCNGKWVFKSNVSYCVACHLHSIHWTTIQEDARTIWPVRSQSNAVIIPSIYFSNCRRSRTSTCPSENATWDSGSLQTWVRRLITGKEKNEIFLEHGCYSPNFVRSWRGKDTTITNITNATIPTLEDRRMARWRASFYNWAKPVQYT